jgi:hypothetical protein
MIRAPQFFFFPAFFPAAGKAVPFCFVLPLLDVSFLLSAHFCVLPRRYFTSSPRFSLHQEKLVPLCFDLQLLMRFFDPDHLRVSPRRHFASSLRFSLQQGKLFHFVLAGAAAGQCFVDVPPAVFCSPAIRKSGAGLPPAGCAFGSRCRASNA